MRKYKIFIVDDHALIRRGMRQLFEDEPSLTVVGEAEDMESGLAAVRRTEIDLVIMDISLPDGSGLDLISRIHRLLPDLPILVSSMHEERFYAERALRSGAMGYVSKLEAPEHLVRAVKTILSGKRYLSRGLTERLQLNGGEPQGGELAPSPLEALSNREMGVFQQIGAGLGTVKIADNLNVSVKTIETHRAHIKKKLKLGTSAELSRHALQWHLQGGAEAG